MSEVVLQPLVCDHVDETIRERVVTEAPLFLLQLEVGVHGKIECVYPTGQRVNLRNIRMGRYYLSNCGDTRFFPG